MTEQDIIDSFIDLYNKNAADAEKFDTLRYQYGIASRKIHELKAENALLRERLREAQQQPAPIYDNGGVLDNLTWTQPPTTSTYFENRNDINPQ